jgi:hypothetical protein
MGYNIGLENTNLRALDGAIGLARRPPAAPLGIPDYVPK